MPNLDYLNEKPIAVLGAGGIGKAIAADCTLAGQDVHLCDIEPFASTSLANLKNGFQFYGDQYNKYGFHREGTAFFKKITASIEEAVKGVGIIVIALPAIGHEVFFRELIPHLQDGHIVHIFPDNYGTLLLRKMMRQMDCHKEVVIGGWSSAPYGSRIEHMGGCMLATAKILYRAITLRGAALPMKDQDVFLESTKCIRAMDSVTQGDGAASADTVMDTGFSNVNPILHCPGVILGVGTMENYGLIYGNNKYDFSIYAHVYSPSVSRIQYAVYQEEEAIAKAMGVGIQQFTKKQFFSRSNILGCEFMDESFEVPYDEIYDMTIGTGPFSITNRYITEDIPVGCHMFHELGQKFGVTTPVIDSMINLSSAMLERDFYKEGYTMKYLGIGDMGKDELLDYLHDGVLK